jgi:hypothetical protein
MQLQLETEGYPSGLVSVGLERARGMAAQKARPVRPSAYDAAFSDILIDELKGVRDWMDRQAAFLRS